MTIKGQPWFVAADVLAALGLDHQRHGSSSRHTQYLGSDEKQHVLFSTVEKTDVSFPNRGALCISESGLYKLILRAHKNATALAFQDWVTREVLPSIRKTGAYVKGQPSLVENPSMDPSGRPLLRFLVVDRRWVGRASGPHQGHVNESTREAA